MENIFRDAVDRYFGAAPGMLWARTKRKISSLSTSLPLTYIAFIPPTTEIHLSIAELTEKRCSGARENPQHTQRRVLCVFDDDYAPTKMQFWRISGRHDEEGGKKSSFSQPGDEEKKVKNCFCFLPLNGAERNFLFQWKFFPHSRKILFLIQNEMENDASKLLRSKLFNSICKVLK